jgi:glycosyltransferase involved in cell wall biosynthesis
MHNFKKLSIIIPIFNESSTILELLTLVCSVNLINQIEKELILVDDCSSDHSVQLINNYLIEHPSLNINLVEHHKNQGKGAAIRTGINHCTGEYIIIQDADLEYDPTEYNILLDPMEKEVADVVYGSRFIGSQPHRVHLYWHLLGNKFLTILSNMTTNINLTDMESCYKLFRAPILKSINLKENRFGFEPEVTAKVARIKNIRIYEVGISYYGRTYQEGKKIGWKDGFRAIFCIIKYGLLGAT